MELFFYVVFGGLASVVAALELSKNNKDRINTSSAFSSFKNNYLLVYSLMMGRSVFSLLDLFHFLIDLFFPLVFLPWSAPHFLDIFPFCVFFFVYDLLLHDRILIITKNEKEKEKAFGWLLLFLSCLPGICLSNWNWWEIQAIETDLSAISESEWTIVLSCDLPFSFGCLWQQWRVLWSWKLWLLLFLSLFGFKMTVYLFKLSFVLNKLTFCFYSNVGLHHSSYNNMTEIVFKLKVLIWSNCPLKGVDLIKFYVIWSDFSNIFNHWVMPLDDIVVGQYIGEL